MFRLCSQKMIVMSPHFQETPLKIVCSDSLGDRKFIDITQSIISFLIRFQNADPDVRINSNSK